MTRGDLVTVALQGKPRPALVVQADHFGELASATILPVTSMLVDAPLLRIVIEPDPRNGVKKRSHIVVDKPQTPARSRIRGVIGRVDDATMPNGQPCPRGLSPPCLSRRYRSDSG